MTASVRKAVGLTGGIATGKSTIAACFRELGAVVIDGDAVAATVLERGSPALESLKRTFGAEVILPDGGLNRKEMLNVLLKDPSLLQVQLDVLAPFILPEIDRRVSDAFDKHPGKLVIVEAPLLFEYGKRERYDPVIVVYAPFSVQVERLMRRSGKDRRWAESVVRLQIDIEKKVRMADYVIDNTGSLEDAKKAVSELFKKLKKLYC